MRKKKKKIFKVRVKKTKEVKKTIYYDTRGLGYNGPILNEKGKPIKLKRNKSSKLKNKNRTSNGEKAIIIWLKSKDIKYKREFIFKDCFNELTSEYLRFDFYIPEYNLCIEFDGEQHFKYCPELHGKDKEKGLRKLASQQFRDELKNSYCRINNINLLRISYKDIDNVNSILDDYISHLVVIDTRLVNPLINKSI